MQNRHSHPFFLILLPILVLLSIILYGLILRPLFFSQPAFPLEVVFILAATWSITQLRWMGYRWDEVMTSVIARLTQALPAFLLLLAIGLVIGSWIVCGTIPMLVYYGLKSIHPTLLYPLAFWVPMLFSLLTGTSWGSVGSIGIVLIGIANAMGAHPGIAAGAIIGGAFFGDKMSPLSDTTNMAAIATGVDLFDHIRSMMITTIPSAVLASLLYIALGFYCPPAIADAGSALVQPFLISLSELFVFHPLLLLPPLLVLFGSFKRYPAIPTIVVSTLVAMVLTLCLQAYSLADILQSLVRGFNTSMAVWHNGNIASGVQTLVNRGGLYALVDAVLVAFTVFFFVGSLDLVQAMPLVMGRLFRFARTPKVTVLSTLAATGLTNALTCNQYATSFIVGDAFKQQFDDQKIPRSILSRSLEDYGTMIESLVPWTPTAVFMVLTLGVSFSEYWPWQFLSLINLIIAPLFAIFGIGLGRVEN